jgi:hypothetical protein
MGQRHPALDPKPFCYSKSGGRREVARPTGSAYALARDSKNQESDALLGEVRRGADAHRKKMDIAQSVRNLLEHSLRHLKFDEQLAVLADIASTSKIPDLPYRSSEDRFAFGEAFKKLGGQITPEIAQSVAKSLIVELTRREIERRVAEELTRTLPPLRRRPRDMRRNPNRSPIKVVVGDGDPLRTDEFAEFLALFDKTYAFALSLPEGSSERFSAPVAREPLVEELMRHSQAHEDSNERESQLVIAKIRKSSPLTLWFEAMATAMVAAVIISGGEVDLMRGKFKIHSLGEGLKKLREAFATSGTPPAKKRSVRKKRGR